jgi:hypothetical protein
LGRFHFKSIIIAQRRLHDFVTCMVDMLYPETGWAVVEIL